MGYCNGTLSLNKAQKSEKCVKGLGLSFTADDRYDIKKKRLTNVSAPIGNDDATTKKFVTDLLKTKVGTTYVNKELAKKANISSLSDHAKTVIFILWF